MRQVIVFALLVAAPSRAVAFEFKTTSTGEPIRWPSGQIVVQLALETGPDEVARADAEAAAAAAAASWQSVLEGSRVTLSAGAGGGNPAAAPGDGAASLRWAMAADDPGIDVGVLGLTQVSYRMDDGAILDADVVVNAAEYSWMVSPNGCVTNYDLESTLAHEFGHLLGLGHPADHPEATMFATATQCETMKRDLSDDDVAGVDHLYNDLPEPNMPSNTVVPAACSAAGGSSGLFTLFIVMAAILLIRRRRLVPGLAIVMVAWFSAPAAAAQLRIVELPELGGHADLVVRGVVVATAPAADGELATDSELQVTECFAGDCPETVVVRRRGGEQDGRGLWIDSEAELDTGAEVILYLRARPDGLYRVVGGVQGLLRVVHRGAAIYAVRDLRGHRVLANGTWRSGEAELMDLAAVRRSVQAFQR